MKPVNELSSGELNRAIARLRGEWPPPEDVQTLRIHPERERLIVVEPGEYLGRIYELPDYLEWQHCGELFEDLADYYGAVGAMEKAGEQVPEDNPDMALSDAIRRAWYEWKRRE